MLAYRRMNWNVPEEHFFATAGTFSIELSKNNYSLRIERGKEYLPIHDNIELPDSGKVEKVYRLRRWVNMANQGWFSADMHAHVSLKDVATLLDGEDLNVLLPITMWRVSFVPAYKDPMLDDFLAKADSSGVIQVAENRWFTPVNEELESDQSAILLSKLGRKPLALEFPFEQMAERAHEQGGFVDSEKATSVRHRWNCPPAPGSEVSTLWAWQTTISGGPTVTPGRGESGLTTLCRNMRRLAQVLHAPDLISIMRC
jgi:hypothetical protein